MYLNFSQKYYATTVFIIDDNNKKCFLNSESAY